MKANAEQRTLALNHFSKLERDRILEMVRAYKDQGFSEVRFIFDMFYLSGFQRVLADFHYPSYSDLKDDHIFTLVKWAVKRGLLIDFQQVEAEVSH